MFGFTTSFRMGQLLRYSLAPPLYDGWDIDRHLATSFVDAVRDCLKTGGYASVDKGEESGGTFLVGYRDRLYRIGSDYQVGRSADGYDAVGCGSDLALGAMHATDIEGVHREHRVMAALKAAERFSAGVSGPFVLVTGGFADRIERADAKAAS